MSDAFRKHIQREQTRRDAHWDPKKRERAVLETLAWAASQTTVRRNTPSACLAEEQRHCARRARPPCLRHETPARSAQP